MMYNRKQIFSELDNNSAFLWGARQTGKSTLLKTLYPDSLYIDLLLSSEYNRFLTNHGLLIQIVESNKKPGPIIIDEIQRIPELLNEVHWLIENQKKQFILSGSSPRKILRNGGNLLGGRAVRYELFPLSIAEISDFDISHAINVGQLPRHYLSKKPQKLIESYIGSFLKDEIAQEAKIRNIASFARFLEIAAFSNGEVLNYSNIATECAISAPTVKEYFQILEDTLTGRFLPSFQKKPKRRVVQSPKFYFFDIGVANSLLKRGKIEIGSEHYGHAFEHLIFNELVAFKHYTDANFNISYWRTTSQYEVDFILGDPTVAIEVKSTENANTRHYKGLKAFAEEYDVKRLIVVSNDKYYRKDGNIEIFPWSIFISDLWNNKIL